MWLQVLIHSSYSINLTTEYITLDKRCLKRFTSSKLCSHSTQNTTDNYIHATWYCTPVTHFWQEIINLLALCLNITVTLSPELCLLGDTSAINMTKETSTIPAALTIAKKTILMNWKTKNTITVTSLEKFTNGSYIYGRNICFHQTQKHSIRLHLDTGY